MINEMRVILIQKFEFYALWVALTFRVDKFLKGISVTWLVFIIMDVNDITLRNCPYVTRTPWISSK